MTEQTKVLPDVTGMTDEQIEAKFGADMLKKVQDARAKNAPVQTADQTEVGQQL